MPPEPQELLGVTFTIKKLAGVALQLGPLGKIVPEPPTTDQANVVALGLIDDNWAEPLT